MNFTALYSTMSALAKLWRKPAFSEFRENFSILFRALVLVVWLAVFVLFLLELKQHYHIDVIPGVDSPVDDIYGAARSRLINSF